MFQMSAYMSRRCSDCGNNDHDSGTCLNSKGGFTLFGVRFSADCCASPAIPAESSCSSSTAMRKSASMGNLCNYGATEGRASPLSPPLYEHHDTADPFEGYASDDLIHTSSTCRERKKGVSWTEEEHRMFLLGLQKLGKGDWRGISRNFVKTRTPTQVASHAQKYFLRLNNSNKRRRRSSLFDMTPDTVSTFIEEPALVEGDHHDPDVCPELTLGRSIPHGRGLGGVDAQGAYPLGAPSCPSPLAYRPMEISSVRGSAGEAARMTDKQVHDASKVAEKGHVQRLLDVDVMEVVPEVNDNMTRGSSNVLTFQCPPGPPLWPGVGGHNTAMGDPWATPSKIVKPTPLFPRPPQMVQQDSEGEEKSCSFKVNAAQRVMEPSPLSYKLLEEGSRHSAFHTATTAPLGNGEVDGAISVP